MKLLKILQVPNPILTKKAKPVDDVLRPDIRELIEDMKYTLIKQEDPKGVGLCAPQVGKSLQLFVLREADDKPFRVFINPKIELHKDKKKKTEKLEPENLEGCLSIKDIWGIVDRAPMIMITYMDEYEEVHIKKITGFLATIIQHEYDHLQGTLFPKRVKKDLYASSKDDKGESILTVLQGGLTF